MAFMQRFFYLVSKIKSLLNKKYAYVLKNQLHSSASDSDMLSVYFYVIQV